MLLTRLVAVYKETRTTQISAGLCRTWMRAQSRLRVAGRRSRRTGLRVRVMPAAGCCLAAVGAQCKSVRPSAPGLNPSGWDMQERFYPRKIKEKEKSKDPHTVLSLLLSAIVLSSGSKTVSDRSPEPTGCSWSTDTSVPAAPAGGWIISTQSPPPH